jgi:predicted nuclease with TOPRIM domain
MYPYQAADPEVEKSALKNQADSLQAQLEDIQNRLSELETGSRPEKSE